MFTKDCWPTAAVEYCEAFQDSVICCSHCISQRRQVILKKMKSLYIPLSEILLNIIISNGRKKGEVFAELSYFHLL